MYTILLYLSYRLTNSFKTCTVNNVKHFHCVIPALKSNAHYANYIFKTDSQLVRLNKLENLYCELYRLYFNYEASYEQRLQDKSITRYLGTTNI